MNETLNHLHDLKSNYDREITQKEQRQLVLLQELFFCEICNVVKWGKNLRGNHGYMAY